MRKLLFYIFICYGSLLLAQDTYLTKTGQIEFDASTPLEDIYAINQKVNAILKANGEFAALLLVKEFDFKRKLMQEHFNENYIESHKYPKAYFTGSIVDFNPGNLSGEIKKYSIKGSLTIHGVTNPIESEAELRQDGTTIYFNMMFMVKTEEYKIKVPKILFKKVAQEVRVRVSAQLQKE